MTMGSVAGGLIASAVIGGVSSYMGSKQQANATKRAAETASSPWSGLQPYLTSLYGNSQALAQMPRQYYPGQTYVGPLPSEEAGYAQRAAYNSMMFGSPYGMVGQWPSMPQGPAGGPPQNDFSYGTYSNSPLIRLTRSIAESRAEQRAGQGGIQPVPGSGDWQTGGQDGLMYAGGTPGFYAGGTPGFDETGGLNGRYALTAGKLNPYTETGTPAPQPMPPPGAVAAGSPFGGVMSGLGQGVSGANPLGQMGATLAPAATRGLFSAFAGGAPSVGRYGFSTDPNVSGFTPQFGQAGSLDARGAFEKALSGQPDYAGLQGAVDAANAPILRQLNEDIIPGLNQRATFLNNETGGIKTLNRVLPEVGERMSLNANTLYEGERQRALGAQQAAANAVASGGLGAYGLGLQGAGMQSELQRALAGQNLATDTTNAGLLSQYRGDMLGLGNLAGGLAGDQATNAARWGALFPSLAAAGQAPSSDALAYGGYQRGIMENALGDQVNRWNYRTQEPYERMTWLNSILQNNGGGGGGGVIPTPNSGLSALGGALTGAQLYGMFGNAMGGLGGTRGYSGINPANYPISVPNDMSWMGNMPIQLPFSK